MPSVKHFESPARITSRVLPTENSILPSKHWTRRLANNVVLAHLLAREQNRAEYFKVFGFVKRRGPSTRYCSSKWANIDYFARNRAMYRHEFGSPN
jgi:hypothetical protein